ncbi:MAG: peptidylprolyl isomerase, partial [Alistipes sp.]
MLKKSIFLALATLCVCGTFAQKQQVVLDKVVAVVGGSSILYSDMNSYARQLTEQRRAEGYTSDRDPQNEALEALMMQKLLYTQAQIDSVKINDSDVASRAEEQVQMMAVEAGGVAKLEAREHIAIFNIREMMRQRLEEQSYAEAMQDQITSKVTIVPGEVDRFYKKIDKDSLPMMPEQYIYAQIVRYPKSIVQSKQRTKERLLEMRERVIKGDAKFETLARMYSQDPSTMMRGGEMDPIALNQLVPEFSVLEKLKPGQISEVVETQYGFHIIQLIEKRGMLYRFRHILLAPSSPPNELVDAMRTLDSLAHLVRMDSLSFDRAAYEYSDDAHSKMNGGVVSNHDVLEHFRAGDPKLTQTAFRKEDFGSNNKLDDYNALTLLKVGEISPAFLSKDLNNNELAKIVKMVGIIPSHKASLNEDYLRLEELALRT